MFINNAQKNKNNLGQSKSFKRFVEPIITKSKNDSTHNRRISFRYLRQKDAVTELFSTVSNKVADRPGGYTRIIKLGNRLGDAAEMCFIELVDFNDTYNVTTAKKKRTRRSKRNESDLKTDTSNSKSNSNVRNNAKADEAKSEEAKVDEAKSEELKSEEAEVDQAKSEELKSEEAEVDQAKSEELKSEEAEVDEAKSEEDKTQTPIDNADDKASSEK